ncbi:probable inactive receptor kinase At4g23740 [Olea europaea subsp. europaea]|uniref:Probable inactive receptor kinase At4g23740 n=1 Tax=Olea europaea subsp. europaea TaxID=158383 RepID=A0A8S0VCC4_OLEEU|nr:probable inactive receptor kinase At4g23740 [Olea europaea subsp. europaea]
MSKIVKMLEDVRLMNTGFWVGNTNGSYAPAVYTICWYLSLEVTQTKKVSQPSDVYSFEVVLLELLSRKLSMHCAEDGEVIQLIRSVESVICNDRSHWTTRVFDTELLRYPSTEEAMVFMFQMALARVEVVPSDRPKMPPSSEDVRGY